MVTSEKVLARSCQQGLIATRAAHWPNKQNRQHINVCRICWAHGNVVKIAPERATSFLFYCTNQDPTNILGNTEWVSMAFTFLNVRDSHILLLLYALTLFRR